MTGLAVGAGREISFMKSILYKKKVIFLLLFYLGFGLIYNYIIGMGNSLPASWFNYSFSLFYQQYLPDISSVNLQRIQKEQSQHLQLSIVPILQVRLSGLYLYQDLLFRHSEFKVSIFLLSSLSFCGISVWYN